MKQKFEDLVTPKTEDFQMFSFPKYVGQWTIGGENGLSISVTNKPNWFHKHMMRLLLGITWKDIK